MLPPGNAGAWQPNSWRWWPPILQPGSGQEEPLILGAAQGFIAEKLATFKGRLAIQDNVLEVSAAAAAGVLGWELDLAEVGEFSESGIETQWVILPLGGL
jgi:hypothetical protein